MNVTLTRIRRQKEGIFGILQTEGNRALAATLEHAYQQESGLFSAKLYPGTFECKRGMHQLHSMTHPFETFEVTGVVGHTGILFHVGNFNDDSDGCILVGQQSNPISMITKSRETFEKFMALQDGVNSFMLTVIG